MEWQIFALSQMALITVGVALAFGLNNRKLNSQLTELKTHLTELESQAPAEADSSAAIDAYIAGLDADQPAAKLLTGILESVKSPSDNFAESLPDLIHASGLIGDSESTEGLQQRVNELEEQLATGSGTGDAEAPSEDQSEDLKTLLQQFTKDSREMMQCIQELEKENAELKAQLSENDTPEQAPIAEVEAEVEQPVEDDAA